MPMSSLISEFHLDLEDKHFEACDYQKGQARWCPG